MAVPVFWARPRRRIDRPRLFATLGVAAVFIAAVVGGFVVDASMVAPSIGSVQVASGITIDGAPGWIQVDDPNGGSATALQRGDTILVVTASDAQSAIGPRSLLETYVERERANGVTFGDIRDVSLGSYDAATVTFHGVATVAYDGEAIMILTNGRAVLFEAAAPWGDFTSSAGDVEAMAASLRVEP